MLFDVAELQGSAGSRPPSEALRCRGLAALDNPGPGTKCSFRDSGLLAQPTGWGREYDATPEITQVALAAER